MDGNNCSLLPDGYVMATGSLSLEGTICVQCTDMEYDGRAQKQHLEEKQRACEGLCPHSVIILQNSIKSASCLRSCLRC